MERPQAIVILSLQLEVKRRLGKDLEADALIVAIQDMQRCSQEEGDDEPLP